MSWFLFTINFRLFASIIRYVFGFVSVYVAGVDEEAIILTGIFCVLFSTVNIYVRYSLSHFYHNALRLYFLLMYGLPIFCGVFVALIVEDVSLLSGAIASMIYLIPEIIYFRKRLHLFDCTREKKGAKNMSISRKIKAIIIAIAYLIAIIIQFSAFTPYTETETYISSQNVPHIVIIERGYASFEYADWFVDVGEKGVTTRRQINYSLFVFQLILTTVITALAYYFWCYKKHIPIADNIADEQGTLKEQNIQLQQTIDELVVQNNKIELENKSLRKQVMQLSNAFDDATATTEDAFFYEQLTLDDILIADEPPYIDINGLAFADEETIKKAQKQYAEDLYKYFKSKDNKRGDIQ